VKRLLDAPSAAFLRELTLTPLIAGDYTPVIHVLAAHRSSLHALRMGPGHGHSTRIDLGVLSPGLLHLEELALAASHINLTLLRLPELAELDLWVNEVTPPQLRSLAAAQLPSLRSLSIAFSRGRIGDLPRFALASMPQLDRLRVDAREPDELAGFVAELTRSDLARQLRALTIDGVGLDDIERLVDSAAAFESLEKLTIGSRADVDDLLDRFREQNVEVSYRRSFFHFDPWEEETDVQEDTIDLVEDATIYVDYLR
jgi:hypothetical protein